MSGRMPRFFVWVYVAVGVGMMLALPVVGTRIALTEEFTQEASLDRGRKAPGFKIHGVGVPLLGFGIASAGFCFGYLLAFKLPRISRKGSQKESGKESQVKQTADASQGFGRQLWRLYLSLKWHDRLAVAALVLGLISMIIARTFFAEPYP